MDHVTIHGLYNIILLFNLLVWLYVVDINLYKNHYSIFFYKKIQMIMQGFDWPCSFIYPVGLPALALI